jgi:hypothetical protein
VATSAVTIVSWSATKYVTVELLEPDGRMVRRKIGRADIVSYVTEAERRRRPRPTTWRRATRPTSLVVANFFSRLEAELWATVTAGGRASSSGAC